MPNAENIQRSASAHFTNVASYLFGPPKSGSGVCEVMQGHRYSLKALFYVLYKCFFLPHRLKNYSETDHTLKKRERNFVFYPFHSQQIQQTTNRWYSCEFSQKTGFYISCKLSPKEIVCMKCRKSIFWGKIRKKNHSKYALLKDLLSMLDVKITLGGVLILQNRYQSQFSGKTKKIYKLSAQSLYPAC